MISESIAALKFLSELFIIIAGKMGGIKGTSRQRFARDVVSLFEILDQAEENTAIVISHLKAIEKRKKNEKIDEHFLATENALRKLNDNCKQFAKWTAQHTMFARTVKILAPTADEAIARAAEADIEMSLFIDFAIRLSPIQDNVKAMKDIAPKQSINLQVMSKTLLLAKRIQSQVREAKKLVREFASTNLTIEDIFK